MNLVINVNIDVKERFEHEVHINVTRPFEENTSTIIQKYFPTRLTNFIESRLLSLSYYDFAFCNVLSALSFFFFFFSNSVVSNNQLEV
jgi:hypothetical protein